MRVIAGQAKRVSLVTPVGNETRPTTDRIKETLFNMLQGELLDCVFLDLFSGSGGIGIEALSRGAENAVFIDDNKDALRCIQMNLEHTNLTAQATVLPMDVIRGLKYLEGKTMIFDIVFMDPPYDKGMERKVLEFLQNSTLIKDDTLIIVETSLNTGIDYIKDLHYHIGRVKQYKTNQHLFLQRGCNLE